MIRSTRTQHPMRRLTQPTPLRHGLSRLTARRPTNRGPLRVAATAIVGATLVALLISGCATTGGTPSGTTTGTTSGATMGATMRAETFETTSSLDAAPLDASPITSRPALNRGADRDTAARVPEPLNAAILDAADPQPRTEIRAGQELALAETSAANAARDSARSGDARTNAARYSLVDCELAPGEAERLEERTEVLHYRPTETCYGPCRLFAVESANPDVEVPGALVLRDRDGDWTTDLKACPPPRR